MQWITEQRTFEKTEQRTSQTREQRTFTPRSTLLLELVSTCYAVNTKLTRQAHAGSGPQGAKLHRTPRSTLLRELASIPPEMSGGEFWAKKAPFRGLRSLEQGAGGFQMLQHFRGAEGDRLSLFHFLNPLGQVTLEACL